MNATPIHTVIKNIETELDITFVLSSTGGGCDMLAAETRDSNGNELLIGITNGASKAPDAGSDYMFVDFAFPALDNQPFRSVDFRVGDDADGFVATVADIAYDPTPILDHIHAAFTAEGIFLTEIETGGGCTALSTVGGYLDGLWDLLITAGNADTRFDDGDPDTGIFIGLYDRDARDYVIVEADKADYRAALAEAITKIAAVRADAAHIASAQTAAANDH